MVSVLLVVRVYVAQVTDIGQMATQIDVKCQLQHDAMAR